MCFFEELFLYSDSVDACQYVSSDYALFNQRPVRIIAPWVFSAFDNLHKRCYRTLYLKAKRFTLEIAEMR